MDPRSLFETDSPPSALSLNQLKLSIEALLFTALEPLSLKELQFLISPPPTLEEMDQAIDQLHKDYVFRSFFLHESHGRLQLRSRDEYTDLIKKQWQGKPKTLSRPALETLAIVAYRQPVTRAEINHIRQVDSSSLLYMLKEKKLIRVTGLRHEPGHPVEYGTTQAFLDAFGLKNLKELSHLNQLQGDAPQRQSIQKALTKLDQQGVISPTTRVDLGLNDPQEGVKP